MADEPKDEQHPLSHEARALLEAFNKEGDNYIPESVAKAIASPDFSLSAFWWEGQVDAPIAAIWDTLPDVSRVIVLRYAERRAEAYNSACERNEW